MSAVPEERPPRLGRRLLMRGALAMLIITLLSAASVATAVLLEVKKDADIFQREQIPIPNIQGALDGRQRRRAADDPRPRLGPPLRRHQGQEPRALGHDDARPAGPVQGRDRRHVDPARPQGRRSPATARTRSTRPTRSAARRSRSRRSRQLLRHPDQPRRQRQLRRLPARGRPARLRLRRRRPPLLQRQQPALGGGGDYATIDIPAGYQRLCGQDALDYVRYRHFDNDLVRAARQQDFLRQAKDQVGVGKHLRRPRGAAEDLRQVHADRTSAATTAILRLPEARRRVGRATRSGDPLPGAVAGPTYVTATPLERVDSARARLPQRARGRPKPARRPSTPSAEQGSAASRKRTQPARAAPGSCSTRTLGEDQAIALRRT